MTILIESSISKEIEENISPVLSKEHRLSLANHFKENEEKEAAYILLVSLFNSSSIVP